MKTKLQFNESRYGHPSLFNEKRWEQERINLILRLVGRGKAVLDVGCGNGEIGRLLLGEGNRLWGIDIAKGALRRANRYFPARFCDLETQAIPFRRKFDVVFAGEIIEHVFDTSGVIQKLAAVLKKNGALVITTPNLASLGRRLLLLIGKNPLTETDVDSLSSAGHLRYFVKENLISLLEKNNFQVVYFGFDRVNFLASGRLKSRWLAKIFPSLGRTLIIKAIKKPILAGSMKRKKKNEYQKEPSFL